MERCELSKRGSGRSSDRPKVFPLFSPLRIASPDTIILLTVDHKKMIFFSPLLESIIIVHLAMMYDVFLYMRLNSQLESR